MDTTQNTQREFTLERVLQAPRDVVFQAWTDPAQFRWFFNEDIPADEPIELDLRVGGIWRVKMMDENTPYVTGGIYREIVPVSRLVFTWGAVGGWPELTPGEENDNPLVTIELVDNGETTTMLFTVSLPDHIDDKRASEWFATGMEEGWSMTIARLIRRFTDADQTH